MPNDQLTDQLGRRLGLDRATSISSSIGKPETPLPTASQDQAPNPLLALLKLIGMDNPLAQVSPSKALMPAQGMLDLAPEAAQGAMGKAPGLLEQIFAANPQARAIYERAMTAQLPDAMAANAAKYSHVPGQNSALQELLAGRPKPIPTATGYETAIPKPSRSK